MVAKKRKGTQQSSQWQSQDDLSNSVALSEVFDAGMRFDAATYNIAARAIRDQLKASGYRLLPLYGEDGLAIEAHNACRFRRIFVAPDRGIPFLPSSEINSIRPRVERWVSRKLTKKLDDLLIRRYDILISRSGSIGNIGFAGRRMVHMALSEDAIRARFANEEIAGYVAAFLRTKFGRLQLQSVTYGSVVVHIEPKHLGRVYVPKLDIRSIRKIGRTILEIAEKRDEANDLIDMAISRIETLTGLPPFSWIESKAKRQTNSVRLKDLASRFEGSFHDPVALSVIAALSEASLNVVPLVDSRFMKEIRPITKFRKRTYVKKEGIPLLSSKQLFQIDPVDIKRLAKGAHTKDLSEISLEPHMLAITCSGTIGRVQIVPEYMKGWTANQHAIRLIPSDDVKGAFLFAWLSSHYGQSLIRRHSYGSVILEIDKTMIGSALVPVLPVDNEREIAEFVLQANRLRDEAWSTEHAVIEDLVTRIEHNAVKA